MVLPTSVTVRFYTLENLVQGSTPISSRAQRRAVQQSHNEFQDFVADQASLGIIHKSVCPTPFVDTGHECQSQALRHPRDTT
eukprot:4279198-Pyramimonas_sp.AAC.1